MSIIRLSATAIISRMLEAHGYKVGIIAQPDWKNQESIQISGRTASRMSCVRRKYGFYGKPLFGFEKAPRRRIPIHRAA